MVAYKGSLRRANSFISILAIIYLYNIQKQARLLNREWANIEHILAIYYKDLFISALPPILKESSRNLLLAMGVPPRAFARARRPRSDI